MSVEPLMNTQQRPGGRPVRKGSLGRFFVLCFFLALIITILGVFFIANLFDEKKQLTTPDALTELGQLGQRDTLKPPAAAEQLRIYYTADGTYLTPAYQPYQPQDKASRARQALEALFKTKPQGGLRSAVPADIEVRGVYEPQDSTSIPREVVVDLSRELIDNPLGGVGAELLCVYAIINTVLENSPNAEAVRILIEGEPVETLWGQIDLSGALTAKVLRAP